MNPTSKQDEINYQRIAEAIERIQQVYREQPSLDQLAEPTHLSPFHFQRLFTQWVGVSPKKFMQFISLQHAKRVLRESGATLFDVAYETGLSGTGRLHDLFVSIEGMSPGVYRQGGKDLSINYCFGESPFGKIVIASTEKGICHTAFCCDDADGLFSLKSKFPKAKVTFGGSPHQMKVQKFFSQTWDKPEQIRLHLAGTPFQIKVWETLLRIPAGAMATYGQLASAIDQPNAARAVGTAIGANPIALIIPCHRVIQSTGHFGGYMWGNTRKQAILGWEAVKCQN